MIAIIKILNLLLIALIISCNQLSVSNKIGISDTIITKKITSIQDTIPKKIIDIKSIPTPQDFERVKIKSNSFADYLRNLKFKQDNNIVYLYNGEKKYNQDAQYKVIDMDVGKRDLQQCADAIMRLRAEYLYQNKQFDKIHFNFTSGDKAEYIKYSKGYRASVKGRNVNWIKKAAPDTSYKTFRKYMNLVFIYAGTKSLSKELKVIEDINDMKIGDIFIWGGFPGHSIIVVDMAINNKTGKKVFMLAQSYMPAQEIHVLKNPNDDKLNPWYSTEFGEILNTPEWDFNINSLMRFDSE